MYILIQVARFIFYTALIIVVSTAYMTSHLFALTSNAGVLNQEYSLFIRLPTFEVTPPDSAPCPCYQHDCWDRGWRHLCSAPMQTRSLRSFHSCSHSEHSSHLCQSDCVLRTPSWLAQKQYNNFTQFSNINNITSEKKSQEVIYMNVNNGCVWGKFQRS